jgi:hypothetical protein
LFVHHFKIQHHHIKNWLDRCDKLRRLNDYFEYRVKYSLNDATKRQRFPMKFDTLKTKNPDLHAKLSTLMSKYDKLDIN